MLNEEHIRELIQQIDKKLHKLDDTHSGFIDFGKFEKFLASYRLDDKFKEKTKKLCFEMFVLKSKQRLKRLKKDKIKQEKNGNSKSKSKSKSGSAQPPLTGIDENSAVPKHTMDANELTKELTKLEESPTPSANSSTNTDEKASDNNNSTIQLFTIEAAEKLSSKEISKIAAAHQHEIMVDLMVQAITATFEKSPSIGMRRAIFRTCSKAIKVFSLLFCCEAPYYI